jgi:hypothetical protein
MINFPSTRLLGVLAGATLAWVPAQRGPSVLDRPPAVAVQTAPASVSLEPPSGPAGTPVMVKGNGLAGASKVLFSPAVEADFTVVDETTLKATVPAGAKSGPVQVVTPKGTLKSMEPFQVPAM